MLKIFFYCVITLVVIFIGLLGAMYNTGGFEGLKYLNYIFGIVIASAIVALVWVTYAILTKNYNHIWLPATILILVGVGYFLIQINRG